MNTFRVAFFLTWRQLFRSNIRSVSLIIAVMTLTFLNLVAVSGILIGLIEGSSKAYREKFIGDLTVRPLENKKFLQDSEPIINILKSLEEVEGYSPRYIEVGSIESNYNKRDAGKRKEIATGNINGIDPLLESKVTGWDRDIIEGSFLEKNDTGKIVVGKNMLARYAIAPQDAERSIGDVQIGQKVLVTINGKVNEFVLKGVISGKTDASRQAFISHTDMKKMMSGGNTQASNISVKAKQGGDEIFIKKVLVNNGFGENQKVQTYTEAEPSFVQDLKKVFSILGTAIGSVSLVVAFITIFIVIYINAITRRKYIGIMKAIGITPKVIELSYVMQSIFYGIVGSFFGAIIIYFLLVPYFTINPIDFPFSDGIMVAPYWDTFVKFVVLMFATIFAGYLPSKSIINQNTLNAILGR